MYNATHCKVLTPIVLLRLFGIIQLVVSWFESVLLCCYMPNGWCVNWSGYVRLILKQVIIYRSTAKQPG